VEVEDIGLIIRRRIISKLWTEREFKEHLQLSRRSVLQLIGKKCIIKEKELFNDSVRL